MTSTKNRKQSPRDQSPKSEIEKASQLQDKQENLTPRTQRFVNGRYTRDYQPALYSPWHKSCIALCLRSWNWWTHYFRNQNKEFFSNWKFLVVHETNFCDKKIQMQWENVFGFLFIYGLQVRDSLVVIYIIRFYLEVFYIPAGKEKTNR